MLLTRPAARRVSRTRRRGAPGGHRGEAGPGREGDGQQQPGLLGGQFPRAQQRLAGRRRGAVRRALGLAHHDPAGGGVLEGEPLAAGGEPRAGPGGDDPAHSPLDRRAHRRPVGADVGRDDLDRRQAGRQRSVAQRSGPGPTAPPRHAGADLADGGRAGPEGVHPGAVALHRLRRVQDGAVGDHDDAVLANPGGARHREGVDEVGQGIAADGRGRPHRSRHGHRHPGAEQPDQEGDLLQPVGPQRDHRAGDGGRIQRAQPGDQAEQGLRREVVARTGLDGLDAHRPDQWADRLEHLLGRQRAAGPPVPVGVQRIVSMRLERAAEAEPVDRETGAHRPGAPSSRNAATVAAKRSGRWSTDATPVPGSTAETAPGIEAHSRGTSGSE